MLLDHSSWMGNSFSVISADKTIDDVVGAVPSIEQKMMIPTISTYSRYVYIPLVHARARVRTLHRYYPSM